MKMWPFRNEHEKPRTKIRNKKKKRIRLNLSPEATFSIDPGLYHIFCLKRTIILSLSHSHSIYLSIYLSLFISIYLIHIDICSKKKDKYREERNTRNTREIYEFPELWILLELTAWSAEAVEYADCIFAGR